MDAHLIKLHKKQIDAECKENRPDRKDWSQPQFRLLHPRRRQRCDGEPNLLHLEPICKEKYRDQNDKLTMAPMKYHLVLIHKCDVRVSEGKAPEDQMLNWQICNGETKGITCS